MIRLNRRDVSRIEGFSDAVFGFALTLLVASIEVPPDFEALKLTLRGFLPFALPFALISWICYLHYSFSRTYGLEDRLTVVLNSILLFVVLFFVYPLKVMANNLVPLFYRDRRKRFREPERIDNRFLMVAYSSGVIDVPGVLPAALERLPPARGAGAAAGDRVRHPDRHARARVERVAGPDVGAAGPDRADGLALQSGGHDLRPGRTLPGRERLP